MLVHQQLLDNGRMKKLTVSLRYPKFRRLGLFVGSGVVEAGCRTVIAARLKHSGMLWSVNGANAIIALRCYLLNRGFENFWASRGKAA